MMYRLYAQIAHERVYEIEAASVDEARAKWIANKFMEPVSEERIKGEDFIRVARIKADGNDSESDCLEV